MLVTGARQIGKSYAIREFAKQEYQTYVEINLYDNKAATKALLTASSMDDFLSRLSLFAQTDMIPRQHPHLHRRGAGSTGYHDDGQIPGAGRSVRLHLLRFHARNRIQRRTFISGRICDETNYAPYGF